MNDLALWIAWATVAMGYGMALVLLVRIHHDRLGDLSRRIAALEAQLADLDRRYYDEGDLPLSSLRRVTVERPTVTPWKDIKASHPAKEEA